MKKCLVVYNPNGGKGKVERRKAYIVKYLQKAFCVVDFVGTEYAGHATELAKQACGVYDCLVIAGGDGTIHEIVNGVAEQPNAPVLALLPCGTVNDLARSLYIPRCLKGALQTIVQGENFAHDIFKFQNVYGIYVLCCGLFTNTSYETSQKSKRHIGKLAYVGHGVKQLFHAKPTHISLQAQEYAVDGRFSLMLLINSRSVAGLCLNRSANLQDGFVDAVFVKITQKTKEKLRVADIFRSLRLFTRGYARSVKRADTVNMQLSSGYLKAEGALINIDGEKVNVKEGEFKVLRKGVTLRVPSKAIKQLKKGEKE